MSTNDVPGHNPENHDTLAMGCWAEHQDGSLILVENTEGSRVIYSVFDMSKEPPIEYRDAMPEISFKATFSWDARKGGSERWTWHDKTQFPWDRLIKEGVSDGPRAPAAHHTLNAAERIVRNRERFQEETTAAERVAAELRLRGQTLDRQNVSHRHDLVLSRIASVMDRLSTAISNMGRGGDDDRRKPKDKGRRPPR